MNWVVLSYSLASTKASSSPRVTLWRRLKRLGAISPVGNLYVLPALDSCIEGFQWLAQEIRQEGGEALIIHVDQFDGMNEAQMIALFCEARKKDYDEIAVEASQLERAVVDTSVENPANALQKLRKQHAEIRSIDYFNCPEGLELDKLLDRIERQAVWGTLPAGEVPRVTVEAYRGRRWVTRPRPHVDRLSSAWLIRQFIDPDAPIRYDTHPAPDEVEFDMRDGEFTHRGSLCTFETMLYAFGLNEDAGLRAVAEIVHAIDLRDGLYQRPETAGVDAILQGWLLNNLSDTDLERHGMALFAGLYTALSIIK